jgi:hypothetical protein
VTHDFCALVTSLPLRSESFETGAQNCDREPRSKRASVVRCLPAAMARSVSSRFPRTDDEAMACWAATCITYTMVVEAHPSASSSTTAAKVRGPWPSPPSGEATQRPRNPCSARAACASRGKRAFASTSAAWRTSTSRARDEAFAVRAAALSSIPYG